MGSGEQFSRLIEPAGEGSLLPASPGLTPPRPPKAGPNGLADVVGGMPNGGRLAIETGGLKAEPGVAAPAAIAAIMAGGGKEKAELGGELADEGDDDELGGGLDCWADWAAFSIILAFSMAAMKLLFSASPGFEPGGGGGRPGGNPGGPANIPGGDPPGVGNIPGGGGPPAPACCMRMR